MIVPSYTSLMGQYVSFIKCQLPLIKCPLAKEYYEKLLKDLLSVNMEDLPLYQASQLSQDPVVDALLQRALY